MNIPRFVVASLPRSGRWLMGAVFLVNAAGLTGAFKAVVPMMAERGLPAPQLLLIFVIAAWIAGGASLVLGCRVRFASLSLAFLLVPVTLGMHAPWAAADPALFQNELNHVLTNLGLIGGLLCSARSH